MSGSKLDLIIAFTGAFLIVAVLIASMRAIRYHITATHLRITWLGIPVRWLRLDEIKYVSSKGSLWAERWYNTFSVRRHLLVVHRRKGLHKTVMITPKNPFVFKTELYQARKIAMPPLSKSTSLSQNDTAHLFDKPAGSHVPEAKAAKGPPPNAGAAAGPSSPN
jgi:hypothetical protein